MLKKIIKNKYVMINHLRKWLLKQCFKKEANVSVLRSIGSQVVVMNNADHVLLPSILMTFTSYHGDYENKIEGADAQSD